MSGNFRKNEPNSLDTFIITTESINFNAEFEKRRPEMYIINTSFFVDHAAQNVWLKIIKEKFLPFLESEGCRILAFTRVISNENQGHFTYTLMSEADDMGQYERYEKELLAEYHRLSSAMFGEKVTTFTTLLKKLDRQ